MRIKDAINMVMWKYKDKLDDYVIVIKDRFSDSGIKEISFSSIERIDNNYIYLLEEDIVIPLHRVLMIKRKSDNALVWKRGD
ncbi:MAG: RNA repair domain-containing protein [Saccharolobus sp.]